MGKDIKAVLEYGKSLLGTKYVWWTKGTTKDDISPFYVVDECPPLAYVAEHGINCAGFVNLLCIYAGGNIPKPIEEGSRGSTVGWYDWFEKQGVLTPFNYTEEYPLGTLFIRKYRDVDDQGHLAVMYEKSSKTLEGLIIHAFAGSTNKVATSTLGWSHYGWIPGIPYYEYTVLPIHWMCVVCSV